MLFIFLLHSILTLFISLVANALVTYFAPNEFDEKILWLSLFLAFLINIPLSYTLYKGQTVKQAQKPKTNLPGKSYKAFFGREIISTKIVSALLQRNAKPIVSIDGIGGIGKTALAREVVDKIMLSGYFKHIVWIQSASLSKDSGGIKRLSFDDVLDTTSLQLGYPKITRLKTADKLIKIQELLQEETLLVLDNLETARISQDKIIKKISPLLNPSKLLVTSRVRFGGSTFPIHLKGLEGDGAKAFIEHEAGERDITSIKRVSARQIKSLVKSTGGSPLAMKLVVGQLDRIAIEIVLKNLESVSLKISARESEYSKFYKFIFLPSWKLLSDDSKRLLVTLANFAANFGGTFDEIKEINDLSDQKVLNSIEELWHLSLIETNAEKGLSDTRYFLHPLTKNFVLSDIVKNK